MKPPRIVLVIFGVGLPLLLAVALVLGQRAKARLVTIAEVKGPLHVALRSFTGPSPPRCSDSISLDSLECRVKHPPGMSACAFVELGTEADAPSSPVGTYRERCAANAHRMLLGHEAWVPAETEVLVDAPGERLAVRHGGGPWVVYYLVDGAFFGVELFTTLQTQLHKFMLAGDAGKPPSAGSFPAVAVSTPEGTPIDWTLVPTFPQLSPALAWWWGPFTGPLAEGIRREIIERGDEGEVVRLFLSAGKARDGDWARELATLSPELRRKVEEAVAAKRTPAAAQPIVE